MRLTRWTAYCLVLLMCAGAAHAFTTIGFFTVKPGGEPEMNGWKFAALQGSGGDTPLAQFEDLTGYQIGILDPPPAGTGAFHMQPYEGYSNPAPHVCLGTNNFAGVKIDDVQTIRYSTCTTYASYAQNDAIPPVIELYLTDGTRLYMFEWQAPIAPEPVYINQWYNWDLSIQGTFKEWDPPAGQQWQGDWNWFKQRAAGMWFAGTAAEPVPVSLDPGVGNLTGTSCTIRNGSPKVSASGWQSNGGSAWWRNNATSETWVDLFEIFFNDGSFQSYDFEARPALHILTKTTWDPMMSEAKQRYLFRATGKIQSINNGYFYLIDGSGKTMHVRCQRWDRNAANGDMVTIPFSIIDETADPPKVSVGRRQLIKKP